MVHTVFLIYDQKFELSSLRHASRFTILRVNTVYHGTDRIRIFFGNKKFGIDTHIHCGSLRFSLRFEESNTEMDM